GFSAGKGVGAAIAFSRSKGAVDAKTHQHQGLAINPERLSRRKRRGSGNSVSTQ
ncbi:MAG: hypothetical protein ACI8Z1_002851, partial [Candidatus Azotimanducaceae bacterium]